MKQLIFVGPQRMRNDNSANTKRKRRVLFCANILGFTPNRQKSSSNTVKLSLIFQNKHFELESAFQELTRISAMHLEERKRIAERKKLQNLENLKQEVRSKVNKIRKDNENRLESIKNIKKVDRQIVLLIIQRNPPQSNLQSITIAQDYKSSQLMKLQLNSKTSDFRYLKI